MGKNLKESLVTLSIQPEPIGTRDRIQKNQLSASPEILDYLNHISFLKISRSTPSHLQKTLDHLSLKVSKTLLELKERGGSYFFAGPDWCRQNIDIAASAHAKVIIDTYGATYALPNKNPESNKASLKEGTDMYLTFKDGVPVGTACMVPVGQGIAELGRAASLGNVGNRIIQDLRIIDWLVNSETSSKYHTIFATCRTAPDRDTGGKELMRGGQAVSHMWGEMPNLIVGGFGPLYKKHGALETFAYSVLTKEKLSVPPELWINSSQDASFVKDWLSDYGIRHPKIITYDNISPLQYYAFHAEYPPLVSGVTELVHGEIKLTASSTPQDLQDSINELQKVKVPFIQVAVPLDRNTLSLQSELAEKGFKAFIFTPAYGDRQPPQLWFGKPINTPVVPRYWDTESDKTNPFWTGRLEKHGKRIAAGWQK